MAKILKIASHLPQQKITNENLSLRFKDWSSEKIYEKTGIKIRSKSKENETAADLAIIAAEKVFKITEIEKKEIDMLIFVTQTQNQCLPTSACEIHNSLGLKTECGAFDINQGCTGYIYGLFLANNSIYPGCETLSIYSYILTGFLECIVLGSLMIVLPFSEINAPAVFVPPTSMTMVYGSSFMALANCFK